MGKTLGSLEGPEEGRSLGVDEGTKVGSTVGDTLVASSFAIANFRHSCILPTVHSM